MRFACIRSQFCRILLGEGRGQGGGFRRICFLQRYAADTLAPHRTAKMQYLGSLFSEVYLKDIVERKKIKREDVLSSILDLLCSSVGSLTTPTRVAAAINSIQKRSSENIVAMNTVKAYMDHLVDALLFAECRRFDVKGKSYFDYPNKYTVRILVFAMSVQASASRR